MSAESYIVEMRADKPVCKCGESLLNIKETARGEIFACHICGRIVEVIGLIADEHRGPVYLNPSMSGYS